MFKTKAFRIVDERLIPLTPASLENREASLQQWIWDDASLLGEDLLLIGREVPTDYGGRVDLLAVDRDGNVCVIELKRDRTPRNVMAQALDYASWTAELDWERLDTICQAHFEADLAERYIERFGSALDMTAPVEARIIIVASHLDADSERIARFLTTYGIAINAVFFSTFADGDAQLLTRSWMLDPADVAKAPVKERKRGDKHPRSGYWFVNVGVSAPEQRTADTLVRSWEDNRRYGFMSAGGGPGYKRLISNVAEGEFVYAYLKKFGYVGIGVVRSAAVPIGEFTLSDKRRLFDVNLDAPGILRFSDDLENCEYVLGIDWLRAVPAEQALPRAAAGWHSVMTACELNQPAALANLRNFFMPDSDELGDIIPG